MLVFNQKPVVGMNGNVGPDLCVSQKRRSRFVLVTICFVHGIQDCSRLAGVRRCVQDSGFTAIVVVPKLDKKGSFSYTRDNDGSPSSYIPIACPSLASRSTSLPEIPQESGIINSEEYEMSDLDLKLGDWNLPKVPTKEFYKSFAWTLNSFKTDFHVRTIEQVYGINKEYETCNLFNPAQIKAHLKKGHHFLHIGLVQVGVKPLIRSGLNNSVLLALRDTRHIRFNDSLLGTVQASLSNGQVHFDCFPNFTVHLHDNNVMQALTLNIKTHGTLMTQGTSQIALIYRVYYKCIKTNMNVGALDRKKVGETLLIQTNIHGKVQVPRTLRWDEISFPDDWKLHNENHPLLIQEPDQDPELDFVQQLADGSVSLSFDKSRFRSPLDDYKLRPPIDLSRFPSQQPPILLRDRPVSQASSSRPLAPFPRSRRDLGPEFQGVKTRSQVSTPCYTAKQDSVVDQDDNNNPKVGSPSGTDMEDPYRDNIEDFELKVLKKDFEPDMVYLGKEFDLEENRVKREAYRANHTKEQKKEVLEAWKSGFWQSGLADKCYLSLYKG
ncbi:hypothetical protein SO802_028355 [Lithocarpus litseifolius]|uniref:Uncharacterized protein n=1 Tax=Lithocarpus litseifolius TaxID=425828 RepID=A0AAW2BQB1_9ROSI